MKYRKPKYVIEDKGPDGQYRFYFRRRKGQKKVRLRGLPYTPSFMADYEAALKGESLEPVEPKSQKGTLAWACKQYCEKSIPFARLDERTAHIRRKNLDKICDETIHPTSKTKMGSVPIAAITPKAIRAIRDRVGREAPEQANAYVKALRQVFKYAIEAELNRLDKFQTQPATVIMTVSARPAIASMLITATFFEDRHTKRGSAGHTFAGRPRERGPPSKAIQLRPPLALCAES